MEQGYAVSYLLLRWIIADGVRIVAEFLFVGPQPKGKNVSVLSRERFFPSLQMSYARKFYFSANGCTWQCLSYPRLNLDTCVLAFGPETENLKIEQVFFQRIDHTIVAQWVRRLQEKAVVDEHAQRVAYKPFGYFLIGKSHAYPEPGKFGHVFKELQLFVFWLACKGVHEEDGLCLAERYHDRSSVQKA